MNNRLHEVLSTFIRPNYSTEDQDTIANELSKIDCLKDIDFTSNNVIENEISYDKLQSILSVFNEKESIRKKNGVYYTPKDLVNFITINSIKQFYDTLNPDNISTLLLDDIDYEDFVFERSIFEPTCGTGEFLLHALELKFKLFTSRPHITTKESVHTAVKTIYGNDINKLSTSITIVRILLLVLSYFGIDAIKGLANILIPNFDNNDFVSNPSLRTYDIIIGNPPYVESSKYSGELEERFGNIYANVLHNSAKMLSKNGSFAFVIPLSYIATPRMKKVRDALFDIMPTQYIINYSDRPDCLFVSVHQKLCILIAKKGNSPKTVYTSNYQYWYKYERPNLFEKTCVIENHYIQDKFIPKLGCALDSQIYSKVSNHSGTRLFEGNETLKDLLNSGNAEVYLNMRSTFWMKAFLNGKVGGEYKKYGCSDKSSVALAMCLLNSSLFWWFWVCISDCWHITNKELENFLLPIKPVNSKRIIELATLLENKLEKTKVFVGTKQVEYEYKHKLCIHEIHAIDNYINELYELNNEESEYIKNFAYKYRMGEKDNNESN
ncbi:N-6 DNA methylase [Psychrobacter sp. H8-1]|uniref:N-6 DNA methylase n=1 Tax=Psychrobacter sp. H8-1 TaxID=2774129 RepID=UPI001918E572|nr:N-6 DNA methylase [Psychrobacter sp. H8-1]